MTSRRLKKAFQTRDTNCGPWPDATSSGMPKVRKRLWKKASAVARAVGKPRRAVELTLLELQVEVVFPELA